jgi:hypothetical protein
MTNLAEPRRRRPLLEWALIVALPIAFNVALAAYLLSRVDGGSVPIIGDVDAPAAVIGSPGDTIPQASQDEIVAAAEDSIGADYACEGPWRAPGGVSIWSCRTDDSVAVFHGLGADGIFRLDVTWFGFDESATELPAWGAAAFESSGDAQRAARWVAENVGEEAEAELGGARLSVDGAEGARTLLVEGGD